MFRFRADSLVATDLSENTFSVFGPEGDWGRTDRFQPPPGTPTGLLLQGTLGDGSFLVRAMQRFYVRAHRSRDTAEIHLLSGIHRVGVARAGSRPPPGREYLILNRDGRQTTLRYAMAERCLNSDRDVGLLGSQTVWRFGSTSRTGV